MIPQTSGNERRDYLREIGFRVDRIDTNGLNMDNPMIVNRGDAPFHHCAVYNSRQNWNAYMSEADPVITDEDAGWQAIEDAIAAGKVRS